MICRVLGTVWVRLESIYLKIENKLSIWEQNQQFFAKIENKIDTSSRKLRTKLRIPRENWEQNQEKWTLKKKKSQKTDQGWLSIPVVATVEEPPPGIAGKKRAKGRLGNDINLWKQHLPSSHRYYKYLKHLDHHWKLSLVASMWRIQWLPPVAFCHLPRVYFIYWKKTSPIIDTKLPVREIDMI